MNLGNLFLLATTHQQQHGCSAHPYEEYQRLFEIVKERQPKRILEIGTGTGFTAIVMAHASPDAQIDTIEKDSGHAQLATAFFNEQGLSARITIHNKVAEEFLPTLQDQYDLIFFDGFQIHHEFLPQYQRLLPSGGILILGNNHLTSKTSDQFFSELGDQTHWQIIDKFADTTVAQKF